MLHDINWKNFKTSSKQEISEKKNKNMKQNIKITQISIFKANVPLKEPFRIALGVIKTAQFHFIKINTSAGIYGIGETAPYHAVTG